MTSASTDTKREPGRATAADPAPVGERLTPPPKLRRRPILVVAAVAAVCLGALLSVWAYTSSSIAQDVLAVRQTVHQGQTITAGDLITAKVSVDPALKPVAASEMDQVVGKRAAMDMPAGGVVTREQVTAVVIPPQGQSIVGIALSAAMMPADEVEVGDTVRVVSTPGEQGELQAGEPAALKATVVGVLPSNDGTASTIVNVQVNSADAAPLAARAATGKVALVLDSRER